MAAEWSIPIIIDNQTELPGIGYGAGHLHESATDDGGGTHCLTYQPITSGYTAKIVVY